MAVIDAGLFADISSIEVCASLDKSAVSRRELCGEGMPNEAAESMIIWFVH